MRHENETPRLPSFRDPLYITVLVALLVILAFLVIYVIKVEQRFNQYAANRNADHLRMTELSDGLRKITEDVQAVAKGLDEVNGLVTATQIATLADQADAITEAVTARAQDLAAIRGQLDTLTKQTNSLEQSLKSRYSLTCKDFKEKGWGSRYECLTDGRIHLVYYHNNEGQPGNWEGTTFSRQGFALLMRAAKEGAEIWVGERGKGHRVLCVDVGTSGNWNNGPIVCSSTTRIYADWRQGNHGYGEWNRYFSDGAREHQHVKNFDSGGRAYMKPGGAEGYGVYRWYIRY